MTTATASQAWAILARHARDDIKSLRLQELCNDNDRVSSLVAVHNTDDRMFLVDLSRQRITLDTLNHLLRLANARGVVKFIRMLAWGQNDPQNPIIPARLRKTAPQPTARFDDSVPENPDRKSVTSPSMHMALRAPENERLEMLTSDGTNALVGVHQEWERIRTLSRDLRRGHLRGVTGSAIRDVVVVGSGVTIMALRFLYNALMRDSQGFAACRDGLAEATRSRRSLVGSSPTFRNRRMRFLSSIDSVAAATALDGLDPGATVVISLALTGQEETGMASRTLKNWLLQSLGSGRRPESIFSRHMLLITGNDRIYDGSKAESVFLIPEHSRCEPYITLSACSLLPLSIVFGWDIVDEVLKGAHNMDTHFVESNPRHNIPLLAALSDLWNDAFLGTAGRVMAPFTEALEDFPAYVAALESQVCGSEAKPAFGRESSAKCGVAVDGGLHGTYDRVSFLGTGTMPTEAFMAMDTQALAGVPRVVGWERLEEDIHMNQDLLVCSVFAHLDELAFGDEKQINGSTNAVPGYLATPAHSESISTGNRPSTLVMCGRCDAFTCGQLIAFSEHRAAVKAKLWNMNAFPTECGASIRTSRTDKLKEQLNKLYERLSGPNDYMEEEVELEVTNFATQTLLVNYANRNREQRNHALKR